MNARIEELEALIDAAYGVIESLGNHEWTLDQRTYQENRIAALRREIEAQKAS